VAEYYNIAIVGSGNVAWHLAPELENAGHRVTEIFGRNLKNAKAFQKRLYKAEISPSLDFSQSEVDIVMLCVSDDAIEEVAREVALPENAVIVHTSGSQSISRLGYTATENIGVFYPLQTFTKGKKIEFEGIPILIEAENRETLKILKKLAGSITKEVYTIDSRDRLAIHVAAVFACNFSNYLLGAAEQILNKQGFELDILRPLIAETLNKSLDVGPAEAQTGPAARGDLETLDRHMAFLEKSEHMEIYRLITEKILNR
jgi:predicted short-subunit dehydrogenase-like oxidoreductase (DUF2520 family)